MIQLRDLLNPMRAQRFFSLLANPKKARYISEIPSNLVECRGLENSRLVLLQDQIKTKIGPEKRG